VVVVVVMVVVVVVGSSGGNGSSSSSDSNSSGGSSINRSKKADPVQALSVSRDWGSQISRQSAHEGINALSPTLQPPLPPRKYSWYPFLLEAESTPGPYCGR